MRLADVIARAAPAPWVGEHKIPWSDPAFSARMLREHLDQRHDRASSRFERIDHQVAWLHERVLAGRPSRVLVGGSADDGLAILVAERAG